MRNAEAQRTAVLGLEAVGATVWYDYEMGPEGKYVSNAQPPGPEWARRLLGRDFFSSVASVSFILAKRPCRDVDLELIAHFSSLEALTPVSADGGEMTDSMLEKIAELHNLRELWIDGKDVSDKGLICLANCARLERLTIGGIHGTPRITASAIGELRCLHNLTSLRLLDADGTDSKLESAAAIQSLKTLEVHGGQVTDDGVATLTQLAKLEVVDLSGTGVTDAGVQHLHEFPRLREVNVASTAVDDIGVRYVAMCTGIETVILAKTAVTDAALNVLGRLPHLRVLDLASTRVSPRGIASFRASTPTVHVLAN
jgi:hypothetical protein